jgi:RimJ/RimL family protein N-acetyltransferase
MLRGEIVTLRPVQESDLPIMRRWFDDPETMKFWGNPRPFITEQAFEQDLNGRFSRFEEAGYFTIVEPAGQPVGRIDYEDVDERSRSASLGILIGEADARGKRYGSDAIKTLLLHLFRDRNLHRVDLTVLARNERAIRAYRRIGFVDEGVHRDHRFIDGAYVNELQMSLLRPEFDRLYPSAPQRPA